MKLTDTEKNKVVRFANWLSTQTDRSIINELVGNRSGELCYCLEGMLLKYLGYEVTDYPTDNYHTETVFVIGSKDYHTLKWDIPSYVYEYVEFPEVYIDLQDLIELLKELQWLDVLKLTKNAHILQVGLITLNDNYKLTWKQSAELLKLAVRKDYLKS